MRVWPLVDDNVKGMDRYAIYRSFVRTGDVIEWRSDSVIGFLIRMITGNDVNHTGGIIRLSDMHFQKTYNTQEDRIFSPEARANGFQLTYLSEQMKKFMGKAYLLPLRPELERYREKIAQEQMKFIGIKYDYDGLFKNILGYVSADMERLFCSEAIFISFVNARLLVNGMAFRPGDFEKTGLFLPRVRIF